MNVDNHRHCQATVLGATGSGQGNGTTWPTIRDLSAPNLDSIQSNWKSNFLENRNITDDLADILKLINSVAGQIQPSILDAYPVGSIYITVDPNFNPGTAWGGTWVSIGAGRVLWGAENNSQLGTEKAAGLPNITGSAKGHMGGSDIFNGTTRITRISLFEDNPSSASGCITLTDSGERSGAYPNIVKYGIGDICNDGTAKADTFNIDASKSNAIYGNSSTVQPPAICVKFWKRIA